MRRKAAGRVRVLSTGVYGADERSFFAALERAHADVVLDVRRRRAVRGAHYAYANASRLVAGLDERGIAYRHLLALAPDLEMLALQHAADARAHRRYAERTRLAPEYLERYAKVLQAFDFEALAGELKAFRAPTLLCVERIPEACHRHLVAPRLARALGTNEIVHLTP
jgi:uncharacterized protein (DUF488 family)